jgi:Ca2+-binding EF-hand superfamily protein
VTALVLLAAVTAPAADGYELLVRHGQQTYRIGLVIDTDRGPLAAREAELLRGWKPSADGSDPLDRLLPDGRLLRIEVAAPSPYAEVLTRALFAALDRNGDGKLTPDELKDADKVLLARFDADGDECLTPLEVAPDLLTADPKAPAAAAVSVRLLRTGQPLPPEFADAPRQTFKLRLGAAGRWTARAGGCLFDAVAVAPRPGDTPAVPKGLLKPGREKDRARFEQIAREVVTLTIRPQARGWFEILDADGDGQLSVPELRLAWDRLADRGAREAGFITPRPRAAPALTLTLAPGTASRPAVTLSRVPLPGRGPEWFRALDRNGDGYVSRAEFIGTDEEFRAYDTDGDGLISVAEAEAGDRKWRARGRP